jgi:hypothetical protein
MIIIITYFTVHVPIVVPNLRYALLPAGTLDYLSTVEVAEARKSYSHPDHYPIGFCSLLGGLDAVLLLFMRYLIKINLNHHGI